MSLSYFKFHIGGTLYDVFFISSLLNHIINDNVIARN